MFFFDDWWCWCNSSQFARVFDVDGGWVVVVFGDPVLIWLFAQVTNQFAAQPTLKLIYQAVLMLITTFNVCLLLSASKSNLLLLWFGFWIFNQSQIELMVKFFDRNKHMPKTTRRVL